MLSGTVSKMYLLKEDDGFVNRGIAENRVYSAALNGPEE